MMKRLLSFFVFVTCVTNLFYTISCTELSDELNNKRQNGIVNEGDTLKMIITDNYIDGFTSILLNDGRFILIQPDSLEGFYVLYDSLDAETRVPIDDLGVCAYCDSLMRPSIVLIDDVLMNLTNYTSTSFDLTIISKDTIIEYPCIEYSPSEITNNQTKASTSTGGFLNNVGDVLSVIDVAYGARKEGVKGFTKALMQTFGSQAAGWVDETAGHVTSTGFSIYGAATATGGGVALGVAGWAIGTLSIMKGTAHWRIQRMMGDITPTIRDVSLNFSKQVIVSFDISGLTDQYEERADYSIIYWKQGDIRRYRSASERIMENGVALKMIEGLTGGTWGFKVIVYPERFFDHPLMASYYSFDTQTLYLTIPPIDIKCVSQAWENTDTNPMQFQFKVLVDYQSDVDKELIKFNDGYGICVTQNGERTYYPSTENIGTSSPEEYLIPLNVNTTDFEIDPYDNERMRYKGGDIIFQTFFNMDGYTQYGINHKVTPTYNKTSFLSCPDNNHPHMIDLGLSVKWACCNVGASKPEEYGGYYAWGEIDSKMYYQGSNYKYYYQDQFTKYDYRKIVKYNYNNNFETFDNLSKLEPSDDVAHVIMGGNWRMPTRLEMDSLYSWLNCTWIWTTQNGVNGFLVRSKKEGFESASIFLPAAGLRGSDNYYGEVPDLGYVGERGYYWSSELDSFPYHAFDIEFKEDDVLPIKRTRVDGCSVRPVCP